MWKTFHWTAIGRSHLEAAKGCQDYSDRYEDASRQIVTACDGHGGAIYLRSDRGSRFASEAAIDVLKTFDPCRLAGSTKEEAETRLRLEVLCAWNARVESDLAQDPLREAEMVGLDEEQIFRLSIHPVKAYGTTLHAAMVIGDKIVCIGIGDGGIFSVEEGRMSEVGDEDEDEPVANITYSMCQEDAFKHITATILEGGEIDSVVLCTDGTLNPYRNYENFERSFVLPITEKCRQGKEPEITEFMEKLGKELGVGDDVSVAILQRIGERRASESEEDAAKPRPSAAKRSVRRDL